MSLQDQTVVVVGGTSGIGLAIARAGIADGATVVVASSRQSSVDAALADLGPMASGQPVDVQDAGSCRPILRLARPDRSSGLYRR